MDPQQSVVIEELRLELVSHDTVRLVGALKSQSAQDELSRRLESLQAAITARRLPAFTVDVRGLSFVNSSAIRVFVNWIARAESGGYKLVFRTDTNTTWHRLSFSVLQSLAPDTVEVVEARPSGRPKS